MAYRKLYQREINADVPARIQILEGKEHKYSGHWWYDDNQHRSYNQCEGCREQVDVIPLQNHTYGYTSWSETDNGVEHLRSKVGCETPGCPFRDITFEREEHSYRNEDATRASNKDDSVHTLTVPCFRSCGAMKSIEEQHTYLKNKTYVEPRDNQYHIGGYLCDRSDIGCTNKSSSPVKIEHTYWSNYGGAFDVVGDGLLGGDYYCQDCGHLLDRQRMTISATGESFLSDDGCCYRRIDFYLNGQPVSRIYATVEGITPNGLDSEDISASTTQDQTMVSVTLSKEYKVDDGVKIDVNIYSGDLNRYCNSTQTIWL